MIEHVAIIGAGFSGTLQAINLIRHEGPRATLVERAPVAGTGLAYGAAHPSHLLNVRAANMSAFPDDPGHLVRWLEARGVANAATSFVPRRVYGDYLREMLAQALAEHPERLRLVHAEVEDVTFDAQGARLQLSDGTLRADAAVLAVGNLPPHDPPGLDPARLSATRYKGDPWDPSVPEDLSDGDTVLVIGTGLTMVDVALLLEARGFTGRIVAVSRRGLLPRPHGPGQDWQKIAERPRTRASKLVRAVRDRAEQVGWRNAVDELRPFTQPMWANASEAERARFLRHLRPWWDVHRHRLAPEVHARLQALIDRGQLEVLAAKTLGFEQGPDGIAVTLRPRGQDAPRTIHAQRIVNCTGPLGDLARTREPLLQRLAERGLIRPDAARIGIDVDNQGQTIAADGRANANLYALGPMTRGAFWEIVAVPDIRTQTWAVARRLSNAHWVGGEGL
ncbi:FAD/NAD(P)-binding protein [Sphingomonas sp. R1]|uniref:FAD/NAD(P)-binding protein n=1 Tax=Sphingomonas sp. R1 TaxID=399176 RepID=UPI0022253B22|nr:FAD/NAD(P)-binding protein [Sphingomonas sp. R1]UYY78268.1 FAD/NAD(P)-binding protein [Sphingomonas sp. R1]